MAVASAEGQPDYTTWSNSNLISRITELERQLHSQNTQYTIPPIQESSRVPVAEGIYEPAIPAPPSSAQPNKKRAHSPDDIVNTPAPPSQTVKESRGFDPSKYNTRFIALKFAYLGQQYNGLEHTNGNVTPLPTIEEILWKAMRRTRLILPETSSSDEPNDTQPRELRPYCIHWDGCDYSKAGRTDRGVSAFGQVIGVRVRSARPKLATKTTEQEVENNGMQVEQPTNQDWDDIADELEYVSILNRVLPGDIRIPVLLHPAGFLSYPGAFGFENRAQNGQGPREKLREGWLDIEAMREAAKSFEGTHDFRNFCKLDTSKQIKNFERMIFRSDIERVDPKTNPLGYVTRPGFQSQEDSPQDVDMVSSDLSAEAPPHVYSFTLYGSAFLWHQVRHMVAILFLVGQGLEPPSIVADLLDVEKTPRKPSYEMASDAPLVLWDCIFPDESSGSRDDALNWLYAGDPRQNKNRSPKSDSKFGMKGVVDGLWGVWRQRKMDEILAGALLDLTVGQGDQSLTEHIDIKHGTGKKQNRGAKVWQGADDTRTGGKYVPVMKKTRNEPVEVQNAKWLASKERKMAAKEAAEQSASL
ncbi:hypothetical protein N7509_009051 [Penicillium cosmopolitanum]|uniref:Pseudouridine synthase I TruA alpha/beta domain-containing protein n=1 Tax=Penicillium cosmopolitanum TaxID=1131564 RepID=A0A9X0B3A8_9EURO|nr:uncharacterized protein N7509_009051 [Penicillium cosmopolitanum]KAJ5386510.1 hypothetical protein N7509_009051 [Penicillium cosmopolitanum]